MSNNADALRHTIDSIKANSIEADMGFTEDMFQKTEMNLMVVGEVKNPDLINSNNFTLLSFSGGSPVVKRFDKPTPFNTIGVQETEQKKDDSSSNIGYFLLSSLLPQSGYKDMLEEYMDGIMRESAQVDFLYAQLDGTKDYEVNHEEDIVVSQKKKEMDKRNSSSNVPFSYNAKRDAKGMSLRI